MCRNADHVEDKNRLPPTNKQRDRVCRARRTSVDFDIISAASDMCLQYVRPRNCENDAISVIKKNRTAKRI